MNSSWQALVQWSEAMDIYNLDEIDKAPNP